MAVNCYETSCDNDPPKSACSSNSSKGGTIQPCRLVKINFAADDAISGSSNKRAKVKKNKDLKSPYLNGDKVQLLTRITEKRLVQKKGTGIMSSFPLAANLYKASSDEFKSLKRINKKVKKSVLTLPNEPAPVPQACTVSDMNDSEYFEHNYEARTKKRIPLQNNKKTRGRQHKDFEFYDRDAQYCSEMNIDLDCSSTDLLKPYEGVNRVTKNGNRSRRDRAADEVNAHDVWRVLRNINRFQFRPSPPMSDDSIRSHKKKKQLPKKRFKRRDARIIETCRTEEFAYISRFDLESKSPSFSQSSSFDRVTVIDQQNEFAKLCTQFEKSLSKSHNVTNDNLKPPAKQIKNVAHNRASSKTNAKPIRMKENDNNKPIRSVSPDDHSTMKAILDIDKHSDSLVKYEQQSKQSSTSVVDTHRRKPLVDNKLKTSSTRVNSRKRCEKKSPSNRSPVYHYEDMYDNFVYSEKSGTSKEGNCDIDACEEAKDINESVKELDQVISSRKCNVVIPNRGLDVIIKKRTEPVQRRPRLIPTSPVTFPKLTQTDIKRRLTALKFPIVVLGKDQVSSEIPVITYEAPQFDGLDKHIWPFMIDWKPKCKKGENNKTDTRLNNANIQKKKFNCSLIETEKWRKNNTVLISANKQISVQEKKPSCIDNLNKKKVEQKKLMRVSESNNKVLQEDRPKSIRQLKDKVVQMLYKKSSQSVVVEKYQPWDQNIIKTTIASHAARRKVDAFTETSLLSNNTFAMDILNPDICNNNNRSVNNKSIAIKYPWSRGKLASDFIETVIKKIMNGVYYTHDHKQRLDSREACIQTSISFKNNLNEAISKQLDLLQSHDNADALLCELPGFNNTIPDLEIKTLNLNQIAVKHCVTNIVLQFDVKVPPETAHAKLNVKNTGSLIPLEIVDSQTKIFKCKTTILNAMLPAELCSLLPKMLHSIMDTEIKLALPAPLNKTESHLSTITEITQSENLDGFSSLLVMSPEIENLLKGVFSNAIKKRPNYSASRCAMKIAYSNYCLVLELLPKLPRKLLFDYEFNIMPLIYAEQSTNSFARCSEAQPSSNPAVECKALVPYMSPMQLTTSSTQIVLSDMTDKHIALGINALHNMSLFMNPLQITYHNNIIKVNIAIVNDQGLYSDTFNIVKDLKIRCYDSLTNSSFNNTVKAITDGEDSKKSETQKFAALKVETKNGPGKIHSNGGRVKRKSFFKLYKKCRSTSNINSEKPTSLSKITNMDDFLQVIGSSKQLVSVFDDCAVKKVVSSIIEMKSWISEISARQALLVLLLLNKKETANLTRFRPILLQGIAVNRITRSQELDMEIEVIERENIKFSQYEGISYLTPSRENQDSLLEELYWIAKTTASDYQRPFDETSERLLKSLLEKRKMLNPSYLRVMARYVGLGLLKSPKKN